MSHGAARKRKREKKPESTLQVFIQENDHILFTYDMHVLEGVVRMISAQNATVHVSRTSYVTAKQPWKMGTSTEETATAESSSTSGGGGGVRVFTKYVELHLSLELLAPPHLIGVQRPNPGSNPLFLFFKSSYREYYLQLQDKIEIIVQSAQKTTNDDDEDDNDDENENENAEIKKKKRDVLYDNHGNDAHRICPFETTLATVVKKQKDHVLIHYTHAPTSASSGSIVEWIPQYSLRVWKRLERTKVSPTHHLFAAARDALTTPL